MGKNTEDQLGAWGMIAGKIKMILGLGLIFWAAGLIFFAFEKGIVPDGILEQFRRIDKEINNQERFKDNNKKIVKKDNSLENRRYDNSLNRNQKFKKEKEKNDSNKYKSQDIVEAVHIVKPRKNPQKSTKGKKDLIRSIKIINLENDVKRIIKEDYAYGKNIDFVFYGRFTYPECKMIPKEGDWPGPRFVCSSNYAIKVFQKEEDEKEPASLIGTIEKVASDESLAKEWVMELLTEELAEKLIPILFPESKNENDEISIFLNNSIPKWDKDMNKVSALIEIAATERSLNQ